MKKITIVQYVKDGVTYKATLDGHLTQSQVQTAMLFQRHIPKYQIKKWDHATVRSN